MADIITFTAAERERFAAWLQQEAESNTMLLEQLNKIPHGAAVGKRMKAEAIAYAVVAHKLRSIEDMTIG